MKTKSLFLLLACLAGNLATSEAAGVTAANVAAAGVTTTDVTVAVSEIRPCAIFDGDKLHGFSVELWEMCAQELQIETHFERVDFRDKLAMVRDGKADVAIAGVSITAAREQELDFSLPTLNSGLRILVRRDRGWLPVVSLKTRRILFGLLGFLGVFGHVLWVFERGNQTINASYFPGIFDAFWCVVATMSTVGYGDVVPKKWAGRFLAVIIMLVGIGLFGLIVAAFTADIMDQRRVSGINSYHDLSCCRVATKAGTTSCDFLNDQGFHVRECPTFEDACQLLRTGDIDAVVYDDPSVRYVTRHDSEFAIAGDVFRPQYYGFAFPTNSDLVEPFNRVLLKLKESGKYDRLYHEWFGTDA